MGENDASQNAPQGHTVRLSSSRSPQGKSKKPRYSAPADLQCIAALGTHNSAAGNPYRSTSGTLTTTTVPTLGQNRSATHNFRSGYHQGLSCFSLSSAGNQNHGHEAHFSSVNSAIIWSGPQCPRLNPIVCFSVDRKKVAVLIGECSKLGERYRERINESLEAELQALEKASTDARADIEQVFDGERCFRPVILTEVEESLQETKECAQAAFESILRRYEVLVKSVKWVSVTASREKRGGVGHDQTIVLKRWALENFSNLYPTEGQKSELMKQTNLSKKQINHWFINCRARIQNPLRELTQEIVEGRKSLNLATATEGQRRESTEEEQGN